MEKPSPIFGTNLSFSIAYHPQTVVLAEIMIQNLEDMVRKVCAYDLELKDCDGFTHDWCTLLPTLELEYKTDIHANTNQTPAIIKKGWNPTLPQDSLRKHLHALRCMENSFLYAKYKWDKLNVTPDFKVGDLVPVSTINFNNIKQCKKLKDAFAGPFVIKALHGENAVEVELSEELSNRNPTFPESLINP
ncbi:hypothetical protein O181_050659 [Austropuccinia psidii MF-1]|uniref:Uncharacterized protein n=1 Tax=Austropuccinia psidii MF-1 TaxID=1389203 RepID=A0A9Q3DX93_9BASI|nr:hypothetical protein [Austropuccinia psidii MF-1]